jgi:hypothetical protein
MNESDVSKTLDQNVLDATEIDGVAGAGDTCSAQQLEELTASLTQAYENLVDFTSHVIERIAGSA